MGFMIQKKREEAGLTQEALAQKAGISRALLSLLETNKTTVTTTKTLQKIAKALGCSVNDIFLRMMSSILSK
ncbi:MAG: helix-turn-helix transcriptional regulator [Clostridiales bacterium]|nr:helix-turn-helix transcriptional regulator [Clostridiales bacterium]